MVMIKNPVDIVDAYLKKIDWQVRENANMTYSLQGMNFYVSQEVVKMYWLTRVLPKRAAKAHTSGEIHIHDLGFLGPYCVGWDLEDLLRVGFRGAPGKIESRPPKHFRTALLQAVNFLFTLQGEAAGAQAFSNVDTYLAPFIYYDHLDYNEVRQAIQEFVYNLNVPTRVGFQTPYTNVTLDLWVPHHMADKHVIIGGKEQKETYADFQDEMNMFNRAFAEVLMEGDAAGRPFTFPIPTYNVMKEWDWDSEIVQKIMEMTAKYGYPYFANFINSDMKPEDVRSMCCRLRLDLTEIKKRLGGLFAASPLTGSVGVVTINLSRIGYLARDDDEFFEMLDDKIDLARDILEARRKFVEEMTEKGLYPYAKFYLRDVKARLGEYWANHFNTIGIIAANEAMLNYMGTGIWDPEAKRFVERIMDHILERIPELQEETGHLFNLEATPAEGASYRLAMLDKKAFPDIIVANEEKVRKEGAPPYYTNSTWLPVDYTDDLFFVLDHQESLQTRYTGGTVVHIWLGEAPPAEMVGKLLRKIFTNYRIPYVSITPTFSVCPVHGYIPGYHQYCPYPHTEEELRKIGIMPKAPKELMSFSMD